MANEQIGARDPTNRQIGVHKSLLRRFWQGDLRVPNQGVQAGQVC